MAPKRLIIAFTIAAALATFLIPDDTETIHRSLASQSNSVVRDPRTVQRKMNQIPPLAASNPGSEPQGHQMQTANKVKAGVSLEMKPVSPQMINKVKANAPLEMKPVSPQVINKVTGNTSLGMKPVSPQAINKAKEDTHLEMKPISPRQQVGNLRQVPVESRRGSGSLSIMSRATSGRAMTVDQGQSLQVPMTSNLRPLQTSDKVTSHQSTNNVQAQVPGALQMGTLKDSAPPADAVGGRDTELSRDGATAEDTAGVQPLVPTTTTTGESIPVEKPLAKQDEDDEPEPKDLAPSNQEKADDENDNALAIQKLLQESGPLPGQEKVDELLKAHRGNRDVDDVSNKDVEKERFFRLMYGRSKPNKTGEY